MTKKSKWEEKREKIQETMDQMDKEIDGYFETPEQMGEYLEFMTKMYNYSPRNSGLIQKQFRGAEAVGSFKFWKDKGFSVNKGEKGIQILTPNQSPPRFKTEDGKWKNTRYANQKEKAMLKWGDLEKRDGSMYFTFGHVFDVSQTDAKASDLPEIFPNRWMEGDVKDYDVLMDSFKNIADDLDVTYGDPFNELGSAKGAFYHAVDENKSKGHIGLNPRNSELQNVKTMIHELAHAKLHSGNDVFKLSEEEKEFQAEMVAYSTASYFGIDTSDYSLRYLAKWTQGKELQDKTKLLDEVRDTSMEFIKSIESDLIMNKENELISEESKDTNKWDSIDKEFEDADKEVVSKGKVTNSTDESFKKVFKRRIEKEFEM